MPKPMEIALLLVGFMLLHILVGQPRFTKYLSGFTVVCTKYKSSKLLASGNRTPLTEQRISQRMEQISETSVQGNTAVERMNPQSAYHTLQEHLLYPFHKPLCCLIDRGSSHFFLYKMYNCFGFAMNLQCLINKVNMLHFAIYVQW